MTIPVFEPDPSDRLAERADAARQDRALADQRAATARQTAFRALQQKILHQQAERAAERQRVAQIEAQTEKRLAQIEERKRLAAEERAAFHDGVRQRAADRERFEKELAAREFEKRLAHRKNPDGSVRL